MPTGAAWCNQCFADLRPKPEPAPAPAVPVAAGPAAPVAAPGFPVAAPGIPVTAAPAAPAYDPLTSPLPPAPSVSVTSPDVLDSPVVKQADVRLAEPTWPCSACGTAVALDSDRCPVCGGGFLGGPEAAVSLELPVVGDVARLSTGQKWAFAGVASVAISAVLWALFYLVGSLL